MTKHCSVCHLPGHDRRKHRNPLGLPFGASHQEGMRRLREAHRENQARERMEGGKPPLTGRLAFKAMFGKDTRGLGAPRRRKRAYTFEEFMAAIPPKKNPTDRHSRNAQLRAAGYRYRCRACGELLRNSRQAIEHINREHGGAYRLHPKTQTRARRARR